MIIVESEQFKKALHAIAFLIKKDKPSASIKFVTKLSKQIKTIPDFPYSYRKSIYFDDDTIQDLIFMGYTIIYKISDKQIYIITIFNQNLPHVDEQY